MPVQNRKEMLALITEIIKVSFATNPDLENIHVGEMQALPVDVGTQSESLLVYSTSEKLSLARGNATYSLLETFELEIRVLAREGIAMSRPFDIWEFAKLALLQSQEFVLACKNPEDITTRLFRDLDGKCPVIGEVITIPVELKQLQTFQVTGPTLTGVTVTKPGQPDPNDPNKTVADETIMTIGDSPS